MWWYLQFFISGAHYYSWQPPHNVHLATMSSFVPTLFSVPPPHPSWKITTILNVYFFTRKSFQVTFSDHLPSHLIKFDVELRLLLFVNLFLANITETSNHNYMIYTNRGMYVISSMMFFCIKDFSFKSIIFFSSAFQLI